MSDSEHSPVDEQPGNRRGTGVLQAVFWATRVLVVAAAIYGFGLVAVAIIAGIRLTGRLNADDAVLFFVALAFFSVPVAATLLLKRRPVVATALLLGSAGVLAVPMVSDWGSPFLPIPFALGLAAVGAAASAVIKHSQAQ
jgi:hypothetical protein